MFRKFLVGDLGVLGWVSLQTLGLRLRLEGRFGV